MNRAGLVITGCTHVTPNGLDFTHGFAGYDDIFLPSLRKLADVAKSEGTSAILKIFHAGNKAIPEIIPNTTLKAEELRFLLVVIVHAFIMNPEWAEMVASGCEAEIKPELIVSKLDYLNIPKKI